MLKTHDDLRGAADDLPRMARGGGALEAETLQEAEHELVLREGPQEVLTGGAGLGGGAGEVEEGLRQLHRAWTWRWGWAGGHRENAGTAGEVQRNRKGAGNGGKLMGTGLQKSFPTSPMFFLP